MPDWRFRLAACAPQRTGSRDFKDCFRETRKPTRGTRALPGQGRGQRAKDRGQLTGNRSYANVVGGKLEKYENKIGLQQNSWRIAYKTLDETSSFAIFSTAAR